MIFLLCVLVDLKDTIKLLVRVTFLLKTFDSPVNKYVVFNNEKIEILKDINLEIQYGEITAIIGNSGSGKTTLLNLMSLIDSASSGEYYIDDINVSTWNTTERSKFRSDYSSIIFQQYNLIPRMTSYDNVKIPLLINKNVIKSDRKSIIMDSLQRLSMEHRKSHKPNTLSGGEQQRVAIARALVNNPKIVFADEATGNVDRNNEQIILSVFKELAKEGRAVIIVTHSDYVMDYANRVYKLINGEIEVVK